MNNDSDLKPTRPGEEKIQDIWGKITYPKTDKERMEFRDNMSNILNQVELSQELRQMLDVFFKMHHLEMMTRKSFENSLHNRELVLRGFQTDFPELKFTDFFIESQVITWDQVVKYHEEHQKSHNKLLGMMEAATEHFNRSCKTLMQIEKETDQEKKEILVKDLTDLHKGNRGTERRWY